MRRSFCRLTAFMLMLVLAVSEMSVPVYATEIKPDIEEASDENGEDIFFHTLQN